MEMVGPRRKELVMKPGRVTALVIGCLVVIPSLGLLVGGGALGLVHAFGRGDDGYYDATLDRLESSTVAITAEDVTFATDPGTADWLLDTLDADVRLRVTNVDRDRDVFIGVGRETDVDDYLDGVAHDVVSELDGTTAVYSPRSGSAAVAPPTEQTFWVSSADGPGTQELNWEATSGRWTAVVMNADGTPGVASDVNVGVKADFVLPLALIMLGVGLVFAIIGVALIVFGASGPRDDVPDDVSGDPGARSPEGGPLGDEPAAEWAAPAGADVADVAERAGAGS